MNSLQQKILEPFVDETLISLTTMANVTATAGAAFEDELSSFRFKGYGVVTEVSGAVPGKVLLHLYPETAADVGRRVLGAMLGEELPDASAVEIEGALAEWANVLIGLATRSLEASSLDVSFSPPTFVNDTQNLGTLLDNVVEIISVPIHSDEAGRFFFNYLLHARTEAA